MVAFSAAPYTLSFLDGLGRTRTDQPRSRDLPHVTEVIRDLLTRIDKKATTPRVGRGHGGRPDKTVSEATLALCADLGFMFEHAVERSIRLPAAIAPEIAIEAAWKARMLIRRGSEIDLEPQGELIQNQIYLTPDARNCTDNRGEEYKAKWSSEAALSSADAFRTDFREWYWQIAAYCRALHVLEYDLFVFWVCGDWNPPFPKVRVYRLIYDRDEVARLWSAITSHRDLMLREGVWAPNQNTERK